MPAQVVTFSVSIHHHPLHTISNTMKINAYFYYLNSKLLANVHFVIFVAQ